MDHSQRNEVEYLLECDYLGGGGHVKGACDDRIEQVLIHFGRVANPVDFSFVNDEGAGDASLPSGFQPIVSNDPFSIRSDEIVHFSTFFFHERFDFLGLFLFPNIHTDHGDLDFIGLGDFAEVRKCGDARSTPGGPALEDIGFVSVHGDSIAFIPIGDMKGGGVVADVQACMSDSRSFRSAVFKGKDMVARAIAVARLSAFFHKHWSDEINPSDERERHCLFFGFPDCYCESVAGINHLAV